MEVHMKEFDHYSVLLEETISGLKIKKDGIYVDATLGGGGHSAEILKRLDKGFLYAFDQDETAIEASNNRLQKINSQFEIIKSNFVHLREELKKRKVEKIDGIIFDLGVSSPQFDRPERGFSYKYEAKLDMRMDTNQELTAYDIVNTYTFQDLLYIISRYGEENFAKSIARAIEKTREKQKIETTYDLVEVIKRAIPARARREKHPAKRTFQALRIEVNKELDVLPKALEDAIELLNIGGRVCVISFHSLEDKIIKNKYKKYTRQKEYPKGLPIIVEDEITVLKFINKKPIYPSSEELMNNNRSHSAKLRIAEKQREIEED